MLLVLFLFFSVTYFIIECVWQGYEYLTIGVITTDVFHSIIAFILALSLTINYLFILMLKDGQKNVQTKEKEVDINDKP
ncbi:hypothetical protein [Paenibacillus dendritiformis]|uniref:hypothetical protein n=1 Tax=Paenibacillus dendritiformis TaxID=130049 RepID=UPI00387E1F1F